MANAQSKVTQFKDAQETVKKLKSRPSNDELLSLYALYKQATEGEISGDRPGVFNLKERAKYDAWSNLKGTSKSQAESQYIEVVNKLIGKYGI